MVFTEVFRDNVGERLFTTIYIYLQGFAADIGDYLPLFTRVSLKFGETTSLHLVEKRKFVGGWAPFDHAEIHIVCNPSTASQPTIWLKWAFIIHPLLSSQNLGKTLKKSHKTCHLTFIIRDCFKYTNVCWHISRACNSGIRQMKIFQVSVSVAWREVGWLKPTLVALSHQILLEKIEWAPLEMANYVQVICIHLIYSLK